MKRFITAGLFASLIFFLGVNISAAQISDPYTAFKEYINDMVQKVEKAETPQMKRTIMNNTFDELLTTFDKVKAMRQLSESDQKAINRLAESITAKQNELNGLAGYKQVPNNQLNEFANFIQQDMEQADETITISIVVALLIVIILLLL